MLKISRRNLLGATALVGLAGCSQLATVPQYASDVQLIASGLKVIVPALSSIVGITSDVVAKVTDAIGQIEVIAGEIGSVGSSSGLVENFAAVFKTIATTIGSEWSRNMRLNLPGIVGTVLQASAVLLPVILSAAGVVLAGPSPEVTMDAATARAILAAVSEAKAR